MNKPLVEIRIVFDGQNVMINGPIHDKILCLGIIELAKQIILNDAKVKNKIEIAPFPLDGNGHNPPS